MNPASRLLALLSTTVLLTLSFVGCGDTAKNKAIPPEEMIAKSWKLQKLSLPGEQVDPAIMGTASFTFYKNGRYEILMGELERGKWWLSPDKKVLITKADIRQEAGEMDIVKLQPDYLILTNNLAEHPVTFELVPVE